MMKSTDTPRAKLFFGVSKTLPNGKAVSAYNKVYIEDALGCSLDVQGEIVHLSAKESEVYCGNPLGEEVQPEKLIPQLDWFFLLLAAAEAIGLTIEEEDIQFRLIVIPI